MSALAELRAVYRARFSVRREGTIGYVGADVPRELVEAAGYLPLRLGPVDGVDTTFADRVLGPGVDEAVRAILAALLEGAYPVERVVLCRDSDHTARLYTSLRRLGVPELDVWFVDLLHLPRASTAAYDRAQLAELAAWLGDVAGLETAIATANRARELGDRLAALRRERAVSGADALALLGAGTALPAARYAELLEAALGELEPPPSRRRVLILGSDHYDDAVYAAIDECGATVVAETHSWGEALLAGRIDETGDPLDALVRRYGPRRPAETAPADVQLAWIRRGDESVLWTLPAKRRRDAVVVRSADELQQVLA